MFSFRNLSIAAVLAAVAFVSVATPASAQGRYYDQGGVIPGSADDYSFRNNRWVKNRHHGHGGSIRYGGVHGSSGYAVGGSRMVAIATYRRVIVRHADGTCSRAGVACPCAPVRRAKYYQPRLKQVAAKPKCLTCAPAQQNNAAISGITATVNGNNNVVIQTANIGQSIGGGSTNAAAGQPPLARTLVCLTGLGLKNGRDADFWHEGTAAAGNIQLGQGVRAKLEQSGKLQAAQACLRS